MAVDVYMPQKEKKDPMDNLLKMANIGIGVAQIQGSNKQSDAMNRRLDQIKSEQANELEKKKY